MFCVDLQLMVGRQSATRGGVQKFLTLEQQEQAQQLQQKISDRKDTFREMEESLPHKNGFRYKQEYEKFKLTVTYVVMFLSAIINFISGYR
nr:hypothetical protein BaRGS_022405 [Batillaria attramentaria]